MADIPPLAIQPDEGRREMIRQLLVDHEVAGTPERAFPIAREALWAAWEEIDRLRAALDTKAVDDDDGAG